MSAGAGGASWALTDRGDRRRPGREPTPRAPWGDWVFDHLEIRVSPPDPRFAARVRFRVNGEDVVEEAVGADGRGVAF